jgi:AcrR family transcriptional regulator
MSTGTGTGTAEGKPEGRSRSDTRERILEAAMELFAEAGFSGTTISEVERRVGLTAGTGSLYRHFPSKEALLVAAMEREIIRIRAEIAEHAERAVDLDGANSPEQRRLRAYRSRLHDMRRCNRLFRLMLSEGERVPELQKAVWAALRVPEKDAPGEADVITAVAEAAIGGYHLFSLMQGRPYNGVAEDQFLEELVTLTMSGRALAAPDWPVP